MVPVRVLVSGVLDLLSRNSKSHIAEPFLPQLSITPKSIHRHTNHQTEQTPRLPRNQRLPRPPPPQFQLGPNLRTQRQNHSRNRQRRLRNPSPPQTPQNSKENRPLRPPQHLDNSRRLRPGRTQRTLHPHPPLNPNLLPRPHRLPQLPQKPRTNLLAVLFALVQRHPRKRRSQKTIHRSNDPENG